MANRWSGRSRCNVAMTQRVRFHQISFITSIFFFHVSHWSPVILHVVKSNYIPLLHISHPVHHLSSLSLSPCLPVCRLTGLYFNISQCHFCGLQLVLWLQLHSHKNEHWQVWLATARGTVNLWASSSPILSCFTITPSSTNSCGFYFTLYWNSLPHSLSHSFSVSLQTRCSILCSIFLLGHCFLPVAF